MCPLIFQLCRYCSTPASLADLHSICRTFDHRISTLLATILASSATGLGITAMAEVKKYTGNF